MRLFQAHIELLKAEFNDILGELKVLATQAGIALGIALMTAILLWVGGFLFLGEWLFGSIGWGLAHGLLFGIARDRRPCARNSRSEGPLLACFSFLVALVIVDRRGAPVWHQRGLQRSRDRRAESRPDRSVRPAWSPCSAASSLEPSCSAFLLAFVGGVRGASAGSSWAPSSARSSAG